MNSRELCIVTTAHAAKLLTAVSSAAIRKTLKRRPQKKQEIQRRGPLQWMDRHDVICQAPGRKGGQGNVRLSLLSREKANACNVDELANDIKPVFIAIKHAARACQHIRSAITNQQAEFIGQQWDA